jgi:hypothetical protein
MQDVRINPRPYSRKGGNKKEPVINIDCGSSRSEEKLGETSNAGLRCERKRLNINVKAYNDALWVADTLLPSCCLEAGLYSRVDSALYSKLLKSVFQNRNPEISTIMGEAETRHLFNLNTLIANLP